MRALALRSVGTMARAWKSLAILTRRFTVANEQGSFTTPSFVSFTSEERLIGEAAKNQAAMNPVNTVFDVK
jgi:molecular chaperone DnaK (HSP70)